jgi:acyltransferase
MQQSTTSRLGWIDTIKAIGIYLIILGHLPQPNEVKSFLWTFHVPLFFFVSGFLSKSVTFEVFFHRTINRLLLPYIFVYCANVVLTAVLKHNYSPSTIFGQLLGIFYGTHSYPGFINAALWFLPALITVETLYYVVLTRYPLAYLPIVSLSYFLYINGYQDIYFSFDLALLGLNYFILGHFFRQYNLMNYLKSSIFLTFLTFISCALLTSIAAYYGNVWFKGKYYIISFLSAFSGIMMVAAGAFLVDSWIQRQRVLSLIVRFVSDNTLFILAFHAYSSLMAMRLLPSIGPGFWILESMLIAALSLYLLFPFNYILIKNFPKAIGAHGNG